ncbi:MAG: Fur family transcriptional regulator [Chloroherpetonaceae bacterium]|nr:transcriptional repressor [Chloroherpetonaceae bacterium]MCS7211608.1 transcriptional repressor [Chloroherpetonaceae bacterium]MDW8020807.1 Fur family transcriptional regulator [Chloroherpetonaceae bacterium]
MNRTLSKYVTLLRQNDFKATKPRIRILEILDRAQKPLTAAEIHSQLSRYKIDLATVYRSLNKLADAGIATRVELGDEFTRFELSRSPVHHHHIVCIDCGTVKEIDLCNLDAIASDISRATGFTHIEHQVVFRGYCASCATHHQDLQPS